MKMADTRASLSEGPLSPPTSDPTQDAEDKMSRGDRTRAKKPRGSFSKNINPESTRSVLFMTSDKLERKRKLDRHNQRTSRAKTKARVEELEKENDHLKCQLDAAHQSKAQMQSTLDRMKKCIRSSYFAMMEIEGDHPAVQSSIEFPDSPQRLSNGYPKNRQRSSEVQSAFDSSSDKHNSNDAMEVMHHDLPVPGSTSTMPHGWSFTDQLAGFKYDMPARQAPRKEPGLDLGALDFTFGAIDQDLETNPDPSVDAPWSGSLEQALHHARRNSRYTVSPPDVPVWSIALKHLPPQNQLDRLMQSMADALAGLAGCCSRSLSSYSGSGSGPGGSGSGSQTPTFPSVQSLLNLEDAAGESPAHPVSTALCEHGSSWTDFRGFPEKVAILHCIGRLVRWQVQPNRANWDALMPAQRPTAAQREVPHPWWLDPIPWPGARDYILEQKGWHFFQGLRGHFNANFSINWPHSPQDILVSNAQGEMVPSPAFLDHLSDMRNWTLDTEWPEELEFMREFAPRCVGV